MVRHRSLSAFMNILLFASCALLLLGAFSSSAHGQSVTFAGTQSTVLAGGFSQPWAVAVDRAGDIFIADPNNNRVVELPAGGGAQTTVGSGLSNPNGVAVDGAGDVFIADTNNNRVVEVPAGGGPQTTVAARGLDNPFGVAADGAGDVFIADTLNNRVVEVPAGGGAQITITVRSKLKYPAAVAVDGAGNVFIADYGNNRVVKVPVGGGAQNTVGSGLFEPEGVALDGAGDVFIADTYNSRVVEVLAAGGTQITVGSGFLLPTAAAVDGAGNVFIADYGASQVVEVQRVAPNFGNVNVCAAGQTAPSPCSQTLTLNYNVVATTTFGTTNVVTQGAPNLDFKLSPGGTCTGTVSAGSTCTVNVMFSPLAPGMRMGAVQLTDNLGNLLVTTMVYGVGQGPAIAFAPGAQTTVPASGLSGPSVVAVDGAGDLFIADSNNNRVVEIPVGGGAQTTGGSGLSNPRGMAVDGAGDLFIADSSNNRVVEVPAGGGGQTTVGSGLSNPRGMAVDGAGDLFIADSNNNRVVKVPVGGGAQTTVGSGLNNPTAVSVDGAGDVLIADSNNNRVVQVPVGGGAQTTVGSGLSNPTAVAEDGAGDIFIADSSNNRVVEVPAGGGPQTTVSASGLSNPYGVAVDGVGDVFIADYSNNRVVEIRRSQSPTLSFASTAVGTTSSDSPQSVTIQNIGNQPLNAVTPGLIVGGPNFFQVAGSGTPADCNSSFALTPGETCNLSISFEPQSVGPLTSTATFTDNALNASPSASQSIALQGTATAVTATKLVSSLNPSTYSQSVTFTATVTSTGGGTPTGTVTFTDGSNVLGVISLSGGQAALTTSTLGAGSHSVIANYGGDTNYQSSASTALTQTVQIASTSLGLTCNQNPSSYNQAVLFTASVTPQFGGSATGKVTFYDNASPLGTVAVSSNQATITLSTLSLGTDQITATYSGDSNLAGSTSPALLQVVNKASTTTGVISSRNPAFVGQTITYTATVADKFLGTVSGTVNFTSNGVKLGSTTLVNGQASVTTSFSMSGNHSILAKYVGDANNASSTSPALKQVVNKYPSTMWVVSSVNPSIVGQTVTFTATVTSGATGTVTFKSRGATLAIVPLTGNAASLSTSTLAAGTDSITALYSGDATFAGSTSPVLKQVVNKP
jgi:large repetitive protein